MREGEGTEELEARLAGVKLEPVSSEGRSGSPVLKETLVDRLYKRGQREEEEEQIMMALAQERQRKAKVGMCGMLLSGQVSTGPFFKPVEYFLP